MYATVKLSLLIKTMRSKIRNRSMCYCYLNTTSLRRNILDIYHNYLLTSVRVGGAPPIWKQAQVQGMKESRLTIRGDGD